MCSVEREGERDGEEEESRSRANPGGRRRPWPALTSLPALLTLRPTPASVTQRLQASAGVGGRGLYLLSFPPSRSKPLALPVALLHPPSLPGTSVCSQPSCSNLPPQHVHAHTHTHRHTHTHTHTHGSCFSVSTATAISGLMTDAVVVNSPISCQGSAIRVANANATVLVNAKKGGVAFGALVSLRRRRF